MFVSSALAALVEILMAGSFKGVPAKVVVQ